MIRRRLRVAVFHLGFFYSGGGEKLVLEEIRGLRALGHDVTCFAPFVDKDNCYPHDPAIGEVRRLLPAPPSWLPLKDPIWVTLCAILIPFMFARFLSFDVLFGANQPGPWFAYVLSRILGKPYVIYLAQALRLLHPREIDLQNGIRIREGDSRYLATLARICGAFIDWADRISVRNADVVLTNGDHVGRWISEVYGAKNEVCPAGCYPLPEPQLRYEVRWGGQFFVNGAAITKPFILLTNRHAPMKRFEYAIWALKSIRRQTREVSLVVTGQPTEYTDQLRYLVSGLRLEMATHFVGLVSEADLAKLYASAAAYVYPSPEEDFGMGIIEAMAAGTPVVAWKNGGPTVTVDDRKTGFLVDPYDTEAFAEGLFTLISNPALAERMGRAGHRRAQEFFSYERHNKHLETAFLQALEMRSGSARNVKSAAVTSDLGEVIRVSDSREI